MVRSHALYPTELRSHSKTGGERGIRTLDGLLTHTPLAGARLRPLGHLSGARNLPLISQFSDRCITTSTMTGVQPLKPTANMNAGNLAPPTLRESGGAQEGGKDTCQYCFSKALKQLNFREIGLTRHIPVAPVAGTIK